MYDDLEAAIEALDPPVDGQVLVRLLELQDRLAAKVAAAVGEFDAADLWDLDGSVSMPAWLRTHAGITHADARQRTRTAQRVHRCPELRSAWVDGRLSQGQVDAVVANVTDRAAAMFEDHEAGVVDALVGLDVRDTTIAMRSWAVRAEFALSLEGDLPDETGRLHLSRMLDGRGRLDADLDPEVHELARTALALAESKDAEGEERTPARRRHDALADILRHFLDHQKVRLGGRRRPHLNVVVDLEALRSGGPGRTLDGTPIDGATIRRIACDAGIHRVVTDGRSSILDYGRTTRSIPPAVFTSLVLRDGGCRFPGCDRPGEWTEGHHIEFWELGGRTDLSNLALLCSRHHHLIHTRGWHLKLLPSAVVEVTAPDGTVRCGDPPRASGP